MYTDKLIANCKKNLRRILGSCKQTSFGKTNSLSLASTQRVNVLQQVEGQVQESVYLWEKNYCFYIQLRRRKRNTLNIMWPRTWPHTVFLFQAKNQELFSLSSRGNKRQFWQIFVEALGEFPNYFIQSKPSASAHEYFGSKRANNYVMLLSNFWGENRGLSLRNSLYCFLAL